MSDEPKKRDGRRWDWATASVASGIVCIVGFIAPRWFYQLDVLPGWALALVGLIGFALLLAGYMKILRVARAARKS
jgi:hypothetical protein